MISFRSLVPAAVMAAALMAWTPPAHAQAAGPATVPPSAQPPAPPPFTAGWQEGFVVQSANADYRLQIGLLLQSDQRWVLDDPQNSTTNMFTFRRIRPILQGRVARSAAAYTRPHEYDVSREPSDGGLWATVSEMNAVGPS